MASESCAWCGRTPIGWYEISMHGEITCTSHSAPGRCDLCTRPRSPGAGWATTPRRRCPTCAADAVDTQEQARARIPHIRAQMAALGIDLPQRVRVRLVDELPPDGGCEVLGATYSWQHSTTVTGIDVVRGLTGARFGATVAHEIGHAWLVQRGAPVTDPVLIEGICEVFASAWLKRQPGSYPDALRETMRTNPDRVYGDGYRRVREAVLCKGIRAVLHSLSTSGTLP